MPSNPSTTQIQRVGLSMFLITTPSGARLLTDPWIVYDPVLAPGWGDADTLRQVDALLVSHGHFDHSAGIKNVTDANPEVETITFYELGLQLMAAGFENVKHANIGGSKTFRDARATFVPAAHSTTYGESYSGAGRDYAGVAAGIVIQVDEGPTIYYAGDTGMSAEMTVVRDYFDPDLVILPVGGWLTMDPDQAAYAAGTLLKARHAMPCHYVPPVDSSPSPNALAQAIERQPNLGELVDRGAEFERLMGGRYPDTRVTVLEIGDPPIEL